MTAWAASASAFLFISYAARADQLGLPSSALGETAQVCRILFRAKYLIPVAYFTGG